MYNTTHTHTDSYLPTDAITDPAKITALLEADAQKEDKPTNPGPEPHPTAQLPEPSAPDGIAALSYLLRFLTPHIERMVEKKFNAMVDNTMTLTKLDADIEQKMRDIAADVADSAIEAHEHNTDHWGEDYLEDKIGDALRNHDGILSERRIEEMISDAIENHRYEDEHIAESDVDSKLDDFVSTDNIDEYVVEALKRVEFKIDVTEKE